MEGTGPLDLCRVTSAACFRYTHSDVMTLTTTVSPFGNAGGRGAKRGRRLPRFQSTSKAVRASRPRPGANLSSKRTMRQHNMLVREQLEFIGHLHRERIERLEYETWASRPWDGLGTQRFAVGGCCEAARWVQSRTHTERTWSRGEVS